jgi:hypothetical protein
MTTVITTRNSVYEIYGNRARRVAGLNPPTSCFSPQGEWKQFKSWSIADGHAYFWWNDTQCTRTSTILETEATTEGVEFDKAASQ